MDKLSGQKLQRLLDHAAYQVKQANAVIQTQARTIQAYQRQAEAQKLASEMREKNLSPTWGQSPEETIHHIMQLPPSKLAAVKEAVNMAAPHDPFAYLDETSSSQGGGRRAGGSLFEQFVLGNVS